MRAMIMAAGIGTRLRPVTDLLPKPMAPIVNRPALYHILRLLNRHGVREVVINLHHLPEVIKALPGRRESSGHGYQVLVGARALGHRRRGQEERGLPGPGHLPGHERRFSHRPRSDGAGGAASSHTGR